MTKKERVLKEQIKELERLVEIKDAVIAELKTLIRQPSYFPLITSSGTDVILTNDGVTSAVNYPVTTTMDSN